MTLSSQPAPRCPRCRGVLGWVPVAEEQMLCCEACGGGLLTAAASAHLLRGQGDPSRWFEQGLAQHLGESGFHCPNPVHNEPVVMHRCTVQDRQLKAEVDACPGCRAVWLDPGEGDTLRDLLRMAAFDAATFEARFARRPMTTPNFRPDMTIHNVLAEAMDVPTVVLPLAPDPTAQGTPKSSAPFGDHPWGVWLVLGLVVLAYLWQRAVGWEVVRPLTLVPSALADGRALHTCVTSGFLHAGLAHLAGNGYFLYLFGRGVHRRIGAAGFLGLYVLSMLAGDGLHVLLHPTSDVPSLGASGAVSGLMGAFMVLFPRATVRISPLFGAEMGARSYLGIWFALQFTLPVLEPRVSWSAHVGGFVAGLMVGLAVKWARPGMQP